MSDDETTIRPALSPEEWKDVLKSTDENGAASADVATYAMAGRFPAAAAVALIRQPFGFTAEDVAFLRHTAHDEWNGDEMEEGRKLLDLASRIASLLPPASPSQDATHD